MGGPYLGAFTASWLISVVSWRADYGFLAGLHVLSTLMVIFLGDETLYDRPVLQPRPKGVVGRVKLLVGYSGWKTESRPGLWTVCVDIMKVQIKPQILFLCA